MTDRPASAGGGPGRLGWVLALGLLAAGCGTGSEAPMTLAEARGVEAAFDRAAEAYPLFEAGRYEEAEAVFLSVLAELPDPRRAAGVGTLLSWGPETGYDERYARVVAGAALCRLRLRRFAGAEELLDRALLLAPRAAEVHGLLGVVRLRAGRHAEALESLRRAVELGDRRAETLLRLGEAALRVDDRPMARWALAEAVRLGDREGGIEGWGRRLEAERLTAELDVAAGRPEAARRRLEAVLAESPGDAAARYQLIGVLTRLGLEDEAAGHAAAVERDASRLADQQAALREPGRSDGESRAVAAGYERLGLLHHAAVHYRQALARDPGDGVSRAALEDIQRRVEAADDAAARGKP